jgi:hypothetical protein
MAYLQALVLFTVGTAFCGIAPTFGFLTASRFLAGMGGGGMGTVASVLVADLFPPADRGFYQGLSFAVFGAGMGLGGPIGGALTQVFGWRAAFYGLFHSFSVSRDSAAANRILTNTSVSHSSATRRYHGSDSGGTGSSCWGGCTNELEEARPGRLRRIFDPPAVGEWCNYPSICTSTSTVLA